MPGVEAQAESDVSCSADKDKILLYKTKYVWFIKAYLNLIDS